MAKTNEERLDAIEQNLDALVTKMTAPAARNGTSTSEMKMAAITGMFGLAMVGLGVYKNRPDLLDAGMVMLTGATAGYSVSRGLAKLGK